MGKALIKFDGRYYEINGLLLKRLVGTEQSETVTGGGGGRGASVGNDKVTAQCGRLCVRCVEIKKQESSILRK